MRKLLLHSKHITYTSAWGRDSTCSCTPHSKPERQSTTVCASHLQRADAQAEITLGCKRIKRLFAKWVTCAHDVMKLLRERNEVWRWPEPCQAEPMELDYSWPREALISQIRREEGARELTHNLFCVCVCVYFCDTESRMKADSQVLQKGHKKYLKRSCGYKNLKSMGFFFIINISLQIFKVPK